MNRPAARCLVANASNPSTRERDGDERPLAGGLAEPEPLPAIGQVHELALPQPIERLAPRDHRRERDDDGRQPQPGDQRAVDRAHEGADGDRRGQHECERPFHRREQTGAHAAHGELRADGNVNLPADDDQRHAARDHQRRRFAGEQREQRLRLEERRRRDREKDQQHAQGDSHGPFSEVCFQHAVAMRFKVSTPG